MHLVTDENGNVVAHGNHHHDHEHHHGETGAGHDHHDTEQSPDKSLALLSYMYDHNAHHTEEILDVAARMEQAGKSEVAAKIRAAAAQFEAGNALLHEALHLYK